MARIASAQTVHLTLADTGEALRHRIAASVVDALRTGALGPGDLLPSSRALATGLGVSRTAVVDAYDELSAAGFVESRPGSGTRIVPGAGSAARAGVTAHVSAGKPPAPPRKPEPVAMELDLTPGLPDTELISNRDWRSAWRAAAGGPVSHTVPGPNAHRRLRDALAVHLRRTRGVVASPDEIVVVPGVAAALRTLVTAAGLAGRQVAFEDPGYAKARAALTGAGALIRPIPVDTDGLDPTAIRPDDAAVYCTPAHQYPMGARMPASRRATLVSESVAARRWVIEDDYDGEFRYGVAPLPALRAALGGRDTVAYIGTASKVLTPALRLAWLIPPAPLLTAVHEALATSGESVCAITADALAGFVESGSLTRHLARSNRTYAARRHAFVDALRVHLPDVNPLGVEAGLHVALRLPDGCDDRAIADELERRGVSVRALTAYHATDSGPRGLLCGYARLPESRADEAAQVIADVVSGSIEAAVGSAGSCTTSGS
ncbi:PLP-dependent aminotransferase family protein [Rhodococcus sp. Q]|uniref:MocR-like pyridoxine biosynthesis transcription factor PdxR n=1 Tax=Rhodococcus sp. Q TaxID=2502252 RepID=UPI0010F54380|nr:PLP-dependent aminotransferase family protein [Rhodococcus sp. Q]